jgi:hypothetical protein
MLFCMSSPCHSVFFGNCQVMRKAERIITTFESTLGLLACVKVMPILLGQGGLLE